MNDPEAASAWIRGLGGFRTELLVRGFGLMLCLAGLGRVGRGTWARFAEVYPASLMVLMLCGALLLAGGARLIVLVPCCIAGWVFILQVMGGNVGPGLNMQAAEYPLFPLVPTVLLLIAGAQWPFARTEKEFSNGDFDRLAVKFFRLLALGTLFLVAFHKLNWDFLDSARSCEFVLKQKLVASWRSGLLAWIAGSSSPAGVILLEGLVPILLLLWFRRIGIIFVCLLFTLISLVNAIVVTLAVIVPSVAFLPGSDTAVLQRNWKRWLLVWLGGCLVALPISYLQFQGARFWYQHGIHHALVLALMVVAGGCQLVAWKEAKGMAGGLVAKFLAARGGEVALVHGLASGERCVEGYCRLFDPQWHDALPGFEV